MSCEAGFGNAGLGAGGCLSSPGMLGISGWKGFGDVAGWGTAILLVNPSD